MWTAKDDKVVLVPVEEFDSWMETIYLLCNPANAEHLRHSIAEANAGQLDEKTLIA